VKFLRDLVDIRTMADIHPRIDAQRAFDGDGGLQPQDMAAGQPGQRLGRQIDGQRQEAAGKAEHLKPQAKGRQIRGAGAG
jgi:hypothetical protein